MLFALLGDFRLGLSNTLTGPTGQSESLGNTIFEHQVVRGKPIPHRGGEELDRRSFSFFFDESFCNPQSEYARLLAARSSGSGLPLIMGNGGYFGKNYLIKNVAITIKKTTPSGRIVRLEADIELIEAPGAIGGLLGFGIASATRAIFNPLVKR